MPLGDFEGSGESEPSDSSISVLFRSAPSAKTLAPVVSLQPVKAGNQEYSYLAIAEGSKRINTPS